MKYPHLVTGMALPYDVATRKAFRRWVFETDSLVIDLPVWLLDAHDNSLRIGRIERAYHWPNGLMVSGRADREVPEGTPLSADVNIIGARRVNGIMIVEKAELVHISVVKRAAFPDARTHKEGDTGEHSLRTRSRHAERDRRHRRD